MSKFKLRMSSVFLVGFASLLASCYGPAETKSAATQPEDPSDYSDVSFETKRQCTELGWRVYDRAVSEAHRAEDEAHQFDFTRPRFQTSRDGEQCFVTFRKTQFIAFPGKPIWEIQTDFLINALTNEVVIDYPTKSTELGGEHEPISGTREHDFLAKRKELMGF
ncbi:MAG: hypothetical protein ACSLFQ_13410 [Thermoanaerobaculia bacterium]